MTPPPLFNAFIMNYKNNRLILLLLTLLLYCRSISSKMGLFKCIIPIGIGIGTLIL